MFVLLVCTEVMKESRVRMIVFGPLVLEDLKNEKVLELLGKAEQFFIRFAVEGEPGWVIGKLSWCAAWQYHKLYIDVILNILIGKCILLR